MNIRFSASKNTVNFWVSELVELSLPPDLISTVASFIFSSMDFNLKLKLINKLLKAYTVATSWMECLRGFKLSQYTLTSEISWAT